jgi:hypothetical protein
MIAGHGTHEEQLAREANDHLKRLVAETTDEDIAEVRLEVLRVHQDPETDEDDRNNVVRSALLEALRTAYRRMIGRPPLP